MFGIYTCYAYLHCLYFLIIKYYQNNKIINMPLKPFKTLNLTFYIYGKYNILAIVIIVLLNTSFF